MIGKPDCTRGTSASQSPAQQQPLLTLEISRGRTQFRRRPVWESRFLIGGGKRCHLRLGGDGIPALHSILLVEQNDLWLDAVADTPVLFVNGEAQRCTRLNDGDTIRIGAFEFVVRGKAPGAASNAAAAGSSQSRLAENIPAAVERDPETLTATELVELLERDMALVEEFESSRRMGEAALLNAIRERSDLQPIAGRIPAQPAAAVPLRAAEPAIAPPLDLGKEVLDELDNIVRRLNQCTLELERRAERISPRELGYSEAAQALHQAQAALDAQLERVLARLASLDSGRSGPMRASA